MASQIDFTNLDLDPSLNIPKGEPVIGIDLGTIYSCVGILRQNQVDIIPDNADGKTIIASMVCNKDDQWLIGDSAKNNMTEYYKTTMFESKRLLGLKFSNKKVQNDIKNWPNKIIEDQVTKKPQYVIEINGKEEKFFPEDVSSMILKYLKDFAEVYEGGKPIKYAVITVPAHFNNRQRKATIEAAEKAGLKIVKIINEPTAAAIAYIQQIGINEEPKRLLIFDIGGGTFDVSVLQIKNKEYSVLSSCGISHLGGEDFNKELQKYVIEEIKKIPEFQGIDFEDKTKEENLNALRKLRDTIERVKIELSRLKETSCFIEALYNGKNFKMKITREKYEELCKELWQQCFVKVDEAISLAKLKRDDIEQIILVGGAIRTPKIQQMIRDYFPGKKVLQNINVDEVVAYGATLSAYVDVKIRDITSKNIGIEVSGGKMATIIEKGTVLPLIGKTLNYKKDFHLGGKNPKSQTIKVYEGNSTTASDNAYLGKFIISVNQGKKDETISISMNIDHNSILHVKRIGNEKEEIDLKLNLLENE